MDMSYCRHASGARGLALVGAIAIGLGLGCGLGMGRPDVNTLLAGVNANKWLRRDLFVNEANATIKGIVGKSAIKLHWNGERPERVDIDPQYGIPFDAAPSPSDIDGMTTVVAQHEVLAWYADQKKYPANSLKPYFEVKPDASAKWEPVQPEKSIGSGSMAWVEVDGATTNIGLQFENKGQVERFTLKRPWLVLGPSSNAEWFFDCRTMTAWFWIRSAGSEYIFQYAPQKNLVMQYF
jgi:hypothetical protein